MSGGSGMRHIEKDNSSFGHICNGGGAMIKNSPINITVNIYVNDAASVPFIGKLKSAIGGFIGNGKTRAIAVTPQITKTELQRVIVRELENG